jgi:hypothetical protein
MRKTIIISKAKPFTGRTLKPGQRVHFIINKKTYEYRVCGDYLHNTNIDNRTIFKLLGLTIKGGYDWTESAIAKLKCAGVNPEEGSWPCGPMSAQVKLLKSLFRKPTAKELAEAARLRAARKARLAALTLQQRRVVRLFEKTPKASGYRHPFLIGLASAIVGIDVAKALDTPA